MYRKFQGVANQTLLEWKFPSGSIIKFSHLQYDSDVYGHQGAQYCGIYFDELIHFTKEQFFYLLSRNRSMCGIKPFIKMTCNPDSDSWVRSLVDWYIGPEGYAIPERSGVLRWFIVINDSIIWGDSRQELEEKYKNCFPKSFTFINANIFDNQKLLEIDPAYLANLHALPNVDRQRLLYGNWNIRPAAGNYFKRSYFDIVDYVPRKTEKIRYWDRASTKKTDTNDPDYTVGLKLEKDADGIFYISDMVRIQESPLGVEKTIKTTAVIDGIDTTIGLEQDPGQAGIVEIDYLVRQLQGFYTKINRVAVDKITRAKPVSSQAEAGNIKILKAHWNNDFFKELENFPDGAHDDIIDALSGGFTLLHEEKYDLKQLIKW